MTSRKDNEPLSDPTSNSSRAWVICLRFREVRERGHVKMKRVFTLAALSLIVNCNWRLFWHDSLARPVALSIRKESRRLDEGHFMMHKQRVGNISGFTANTSQSLVWKALQKYIVLSRLMSFSSSRSLGSRRRFVAVRHLWPQPWNTSSWLTCFYRFQHLC